jgi:hypothetical protein
MNAMLISLNHASDRNCETFVVAPVIENKFLGILPPIIGAIDQYINQQAFFQQQN